MKLALYQEVVLTKTIPAANLQAGDVATLVDYVPHPAGGEEGAVLEVFNAVGDSLAVVTVPVSAIAALQPDQVPTVRVRSGHVGRRSPHAGTAGKSEALWSRSRTGVEEYRHGDSD